MQFCSYITSIFERFSYLSRTESDILLVQNLFDCNIDEVPVKPHLELIDLKENDLLTEKEKWFNFIAAYMMSFQS